MHEICQTLGLSIGYSTDEYLPWSLFENFFDELR